MHLKVVLYVRNIIDCCVIIYDDAKHVFENAHFCKTEWF